MISWLPALTCATLGFAPPQPFTVVAPDSSARVSLMAAVQAFSLAFGKADVRILDTLLAPSYVHTNGGSGTVLDKARWLDYIRSRRRELESGRLQQGRYEMVDLAVEWYSDAAVVTGQVISEGVRNGAPFASRLRVTQVWTRVGDRWLRAAFHDSPVPNS